ncbi:unnamed protein product [Rotaria sordida]|uniref:t-SNARE coiled-coil homology domain-containing protein n=1 Tax=Rotaria sordida TaxID=392033 RepID=A0A819NX18_9BILA|nr:unnamed protein product [Rotaria sordida]CAF4003503.1 unnamed protein product [Rotaria sordida]
MLAEPQVDDRIKEVLDEKMATIKKLATDVRQNLKIGRSVTDKQMEAMIESRNPAVFTQDIMVETEQAKQSLTDMEARHSDIMRLENNIRELHDIFSDMMELVQTQGEVILRIEDAVIQSENAIKTGGTKIEKAKRFQGAARWVSLDSIIHELIY